MRSLRGSPERALPPPQPLGLILAGAAAPIWGLAGLTVGLSLLVRGVFFLGVSVPGSMVLVPLALASRSWSAWHDEWLYQPVWLLEPWSWLCRYWLHWPWLCWSWLR